MVLPVTPGSGANMYTDDSAVASTKVPISKLMLGAAGADGGLVSTSNPMPLAQLFRIVAAGSTMTRPADTTAYANGDLVANSTTAASVTAFSFTAARATDVAMVVRKCRLSKSTTGITQPFFRVHLFNQNPVASAPTNGDNGAFVPANKAGWIGALDVSCTLVFGDGASGIGSDTYGAGIIIPPASGTQTIYALLEARGAYAPGNAEVFTLELHIEG